MKEALSLAFNMLRPHQKAVIYRIERQAKETFHDGLLIELAPEGGFPDCLDLLAIGICLADRGWELRAVPEGLLVDARTCEPDA